MSERSCIALLEAEDPVRLREMAASVAGKRVGSRAPATADAAGQGTRLVARGGSADAVVEALAAFVAGARAPGVAVRDLPARPPRLAFLFSGQSEARVGMGADLYRGCPQFAAVLDACAAGLGEIDGMTLTEALYADGEPRPLVDARFAQPALFAIEAGLAALWAEWGVRPRAVAGHSLGEYAAAQVAGALGLEDGIRLVAERGRLTEERAEDGLMAVVFAAEERVAEAVAAGGPAVSVVSINGPGVVVISGEAEPVSEVLTGLRAEGIVAKPLRISHPFHCRCIDPILDGLEEVAARTPFGAAEIPFVSALEGRLLEPGEGLDPTYWRRHAREPVRFDAAIDALAALGCTAFLELGPHSTLTGLGERRERPAETWVTSLRRSGGDRQVLAETAGKLWLAGVDLDLAAMVEGCAYELLAGPGRAAGVGVR